MSKYTEKQYQEYIEVLAREVLAWRNASRLFADENSELSKRGVTYFHRINTDISGVFDNFSTIKEYQYNILDKDINEICNNLKMDKQ